jgi:hypothetical protein
VIVTGAGSTVAMDVAASVGADVPVPADATVTFQAGAAGDGAGQYRCVSLRRSSR